MINPHTFSEFCDRTRVKEVIVTSRRRGLGKENDPVRLIPMIFTLDGKLLAEGYDEFSPQNHEK